MTKSKSTDNKTKQTKAGEARGPSPQTNWPSKKTGGISGPRRDVAVKQSN
jgi:hypothetical protein